MLIESLDTKIINKASKRNDKTKNIQVRQIKKQIKKPKCRMKNMEKIIGAVGD